MQILSERILHNFIHTLTTIQFCQSNGIAGYRVSSSLAPLLTHPSINLRLRDLPNFYQIKSVCDRIQKTLKTLPIQLSAHPSEYITLTSPDEKCIQNSFLDLQQHAEIFDLFGLPVDYSAPLNIHVRQDGDPEDIFNRFKQNYDHLPDSVRLRLVLENNDNRNGVWSPDNLYNYFFKRLNIPITFDTLHHRMLPGAWDTENALQFCRESWQDFNPVFHFSQGIIENGVETRKHADLPTMLPPNTNFDVLWDVELKYKCHAIFQLKKLKSNE